MKKNLLLTTCICLVSMSILGQSNLKSTGWLFNMIHPETRSPFYLNPSMTNVTTLKLTGTEVTRQICRPDPIPHEQKYALDSVIHETFNAQKMIWVNDVRKEFAYNMDGKLAQTFCCKWDVDNALWKPDKKENFSYDLNGHLTSHAMHHWDAPHNGWIGLWKMDQQHNTQGKLVETIWNSWASWTNNWIPEVRTSFQYDWNGTLIAVIYDLWDFTINQWVHDYREDLSYDSNNMLSQYLTSGWDLIAGQWVPVRRTMYNYDNTLNLAELMHEVFNPGLAQWIGEYRHDYQWNALGLQTEDIYSEWRTTTAQWEPKTKINFSYNTSGKPVEIVCSIWKTGNQWIGNWKEEYDYTVSGSLLNYRYYEFLETSANWTLACKCEAMSDLYGNTIQKKWFFWDYVMQQWIGSEYTEVAYQYNFPLCQTSAPSALCEELDSICHVPQTLIHHGWSHSLHSWEYNNMSTYFCSVLEVTGIHPHTDSGPVFLYPNPANNFTHFVWQDGSFSKELTLMNSTGGLVLTRNITSGEKISLSQLPKGLYFYQLQSSNHNANGTLIVQ